MGQRKKILLVDNDADIINTNQAFLEHHEYDVVTACCGKDGLEVTKLERPDAIVLDLMMEKHDAGFCIAREIKTNPNLKHIPILMLTGVAKTTGFKFSQEQDGYWMKTDDFAEKPLPPEELLTRIERLLEKAETEHK